MRRFLFEVNPGVVVGGDRGPWPFADGRRRPARYLGGSGLDGGRARLPLASLNTSGPPDHSRSCARLGSSELSGSLHSAPRCTRCLSERLGKWSARSRAFTRRKLVRPGKSRIDMLQTSVFAPSPNSECGTPAPGASRERLASDQVGSTL